MGMAHFMLRQA
jgi:hypothetical protein